MKSKRFNVKIALAFFLFFSFKKSFYLRSFKRIDIQYVLNPFNSEEAIAINRRKIHLAGKSDKNGGIIAEQSSSEFIRWATHLRWVKGEATPISALIEWK